MDVRDVLDGIEERADAATPGPWRGQLGRTYGSVVLSESATRDRTAVRAVLDRHQMGLRNRQICGECSDEESVDYPCPTVQDIIDKLGASGAGAG